MLNGGACLTLTAPRLAAQLYAERGFNPRAVNAAGAVGLTQFLPSTWAAHGVDGTVTGAPTQPTRSRRRRPKTASWPATCGRCRAIRLTLMLAAYNASPYAVLTAGGVPASAETQHYVAELRSLEEVFGASAPVVPPSQGGAKAVAYATSCRPATSSRPSRPIAAGQVGAPRAHLWRVNACG